jgi:hypothetical protein
VVEVVWDQGQHFRTVGEKLDKFPQGPTRCTSPDTICRVHKSLRVAPAMEQEITDHVWTIAELILRNRCQPFP